MKELYKLIKNNNIEDIKKVLKIEYMTSEANYKNSLDLAIEIAEDLKKEDVIEFLNNNSLLLIEEFKQFQPQLQDITNNKVNTFKIPQPEIPGKLYEHLEEHSSRTKASNGKKVNLSHEEIEKLRESHTRSQEELEIKLEKLDEEQLKSVTKFDQIAQNLFKSPNLFISLRNSINEALQEKDYKDIKLLQLLETFYQEYPISKSHDENTLEGYFKFAIDYIKSSDAADLIGDYYNSYADMEL
jgi:hypothetical protein